MRKVYRRILRDLRRAEPQIPKGIKIREIWTLFPAGAYEAISRTIYVQGWLRFFCPEHLWGVIAHEVGHALDPKLRDGWRYRQPYPNLLHMFLWGIRQILGVREYAESHPCERYAEQFRKRATKKKTQTHHPYESW